MLTTQFNKVHKFSFLFLAVSLAVFLFIKIKALHIPFFWDESWVYGPAVSAMGLTTPSLLPGSIDIDLSRGHPMLFHFLGGLWGKIFGISVTSLHIFALSISSLFLLIYWKFAHEFLPRLSYFAVAFLCFQGIFLAQSAMVLPEMLVSLFVLLSLCYFAKNKINIAIFFAACCLLTKESGAVLFPTLGLSFLAHKLLTSSFSWKESFILLFKLILGVLPYVCFLVIQKARFDWYFYPNHLDLQVNTVQKFQAQFISALHYIFYAQGRILLTFLAIFSYIKHFKTNRLALFILGVSLLHVTIWLVFPMSTWLILAAYSIISLISVILFLPYIVSAYQKQYKIYLTIGIFFILYLIFTALNFYSSRYILCLIPLSILIGFKALEKHANHVWVPLSAIAISIVCLILGLKRHPISDVNQSFIEVGQAQKALFEYLEEEALYEEVFLAPFLVHESLKKIHAGHRSNETRFKHVPYWPSPDHDFYNIISSFEGEYTNADQKKGRRKTHIKTFKSGEVSFILEHYSAVSKE